MAEICASVRAVLGNGVWADVVRACKRIPPLWDLSNYVAVNPFLGYVSRPVAEAAREVADGLDARLLPGVEYYRRRATEGAFTVADLSAAARQHGLDPVALQAMLARTSDLPQRTCATVLTFAEQHDRHHGTDWNDTVIRTLARWCAVYTSGGGAHWKLPAQGLYASWREAAQVDRTLALAGLSGWREWARQLPPRADEAIVEMLARLEVPPAQREAYFYRLLGGVYGWASFLRRDGWQAGGDQLGELVDLLAIRLCADAAVARLLRWTAAQTTVELPPVEDPAPLVALQDALEDGFARRLLGRLNAPPGKAATRPTVQAVFCIDVRSEPMRRHLEAQNAAIETRGFAGFFGVSLNWQTAGENSARCPVLLRPGVALKALAAPDHAAGTVTLKQVQAAPAAAFSFVEMAGLFYGLRMAWDALAAVAPAQAHEGTAPFDLAPDGDGNGLPVASRVEVAAGILKNMGLRTVFGRLVLLCGHEGHSANNPHAAGLNCGACGGHGGAINARVAAALLNDPAVRRALPARGWTVPDDTVFVAGVHDTSVDAVTLFDLDRLPATHADDVAQLKGWLAAAGGQVRAERAAGLRLDAKKPGLLDRLLRRARDWSEVRPEWGLARNAAFVAARRARTRGVDLEGRAFLHEYDWTTDPDNSILTLILTAPMVVASWINLQYFASTVDNRTFGSGSKTLHNRVGRVGVVLGNGGDLRTGLAAQSVHDPEGNWYHEPLRLQVVVEAPRERIEAVLAAQPSVRELVDNGWVRLFQLDPDGPTACRYVPREGWQASTAS
ncbi:MAG: DUF2309 domain-containing protein [Gemmataceae bacterium]